MLQIIDLKKLAFHFIIISTDYHHKIKNYQKFIIFKVR